MWTALLTCALLVVHTSTTDLKYLLDFPAVLKSNQSCTMCLEVIDTPEPTDMKVTLQLPVFPNNTNVSIFDETLPAGAFWQCREITIPQVDFPTLASLIVVSGNRSEQRSVVVNGVKPFCVGMMEKQVYKPGEKMRCRVTCLNANLLPAPQQVLIFEVSDPFGNIVMREVNVEMKSTFAMLSYSIPSEPSFGSYQLRLAFATDSVFLSCEVKRYVLPIFGAALTTPQSISFIDTTMDISVSGSYTYEENLGARVELSVCRRPNQWGPVETCNLNPNGICEFFSGYLKPDGTFNVTVNLQQFQLTHRGLQDYLNIDATITENGTDVQVYKSTSVWVTRQMPTPYFNYEVTDNCYRQGLNTTGSIILRDSNNKGINGQSIALYITYTNVANCVTDENGKCNFSFDTSKYVAGSLTLEARYDQNRQCFDSSPSWQWQPSIYPQFTFPRCFSPSGSFLKVWPVEGEQRCGQSVTIQADCILNRTLLLPGTSAVTATYKVMAKTEIKQSGRVDVTLDDNCQGSFTFSFAVDSGLAPTSTVVVTILLTNGEVVGHFTSFQVQRCFQNKVNVTFSPETVRPGSSVNITIEAAPGSHCAFCAKDASVDILSPTYGMTWSNLVFGQIPYIQVSGRWIDGFDLNQNQWSPCTDMPDMVVGGVNYQATTDVNYAVEFREDILNRFGLITMCGGFSQKPNVCPKPNNCPPTTSPPIRPVPFNTIPFSSTIFARESLLNVNDGAFGGQVMASVRQNFPETWNCEIVEVNSDGKGVMEETVPDTISTWLADVPCNSETKGFGVPDAPARLRVFQGFFVDVNMAATLVWGEQLILKVTAFSYLPGCTRVDLKLAPSEDYDAQLMSVENEFCICQYERTTASYSFCARTLGVINVTVTAETIFNSTCSGETSDVRYRDTVIRQVVVLAQGLPQEDTEGALLCPRDGPVSQSVNINLPPGVVNDSARIIVACVGDPIGISAQYLNDLLKMPTGCGEQTMSTLKAILEVCKYLNETGGLDKTLEEKCNYYIADGVGKTWKFLSSAGCFSTWPTWDQSSCSLWLTCWGYATLRAASDYTFVDKAKLSLIQSWIASQQDPETGAFRTDGKSYIQELETNGALSSFTIICLLESENADSAVVGRAMDFLSTQVESLRTPLEMAMACYAFALANNTEVSNDILAKLKNYEIMDVSGLHLMDPNDQTDDPPFFRWSCSSGDILQNAYYALCLHRSGADIDRSVQITRFLVQQMNAHGGFCSTQDTPVALKAVTKLLPFVYTKNGTNTVDVQSGSSTVAKFNMDHRNGFVLQQTDTLPFPGSYVLQVSGSGCVFCQTNVKYNVQPENLKQTFIVKVQISPATCENGVVKKFDINITLSYAGQYNASNMVIVDVQLWSGFQPMESSLTALMDQGSISQYDMSTMGHVMLYINRITKDPSSVGFTMIETISVKNRKKAVIYAYNYYKKGEVGSAEYAHPCSESLSEGRTCQK